MPLSKQYVDQIFARMLVRYGVAWLRMWDGIDMDAVKADWAETLAGFGAATIRHALDHLPERPPNAMQFRDVCRAHSVSAPVAELLRLDVKPNPERVKAELSRLKAWRAGMEARMNAEPEPAERRTRDGFAGPFTPIPDHLLPPGMRKEAE
jgi:hypothetical protein